MALPTILQLELGSEPSITALSSRPASLIIPKNHVLKGPNESSP